ncbi:MAG TPA: DUF1996 domain-containing protein [Gaiellaceae bacterium]|nr:DUF1996 domain-containing protein [Gaiellaceae bacterium]
MRRGVSIIVAGAALLLLATAAVAFARSAARVTPAAHGNGFFRSHCSYSHTLDDDPILMPTMPGQSMVHEFFGNPTTHAASTADQLRAAHRTSCTAPGDTSAYWLPALYEKGKRVAPTFLLAYYRTSGRPAPSINAFPAGLQMIAGNETALAPQPLSVAYWDCGAKAGAPHTAAPAAHCPAGTQLVLTLTFPDCWDGHTLAGATQKNVAYAVSGRCPAGYPVAVPQLVLHEHFAISGGGGFTLSMGPKMQTMKNSIYTSHADFVNAWDASVLTSLVAQCDVGSLKCGTVGPENTPLGVKQ